jgi:hypothetical protein
MLSALLGGVARGPDDRFMGMRAQSATACSCTQLPTLGRAQQGLTAKIGRVSGKCGSPLPLQIDPAHVRGIKILFVKSPNLPESDLDVMVILLQPFLSQVDIPRRELGTRFVVHIHVPLTSIVLSTSFPDLGDPAL